MYRSSYCLRLRGCACEADSVFAFLVVDRAWQSSDAHQTLNNQADPAHLEARKHRVWSRVQAHKTRLGSVLPSGTVSPARRWKAKPLGHAHARNGTGGWDSSNDMD